MSELLDSPLVSCFLLGKKGEFVHLPDSLITSMTNGFDGSMMNGLQSLTQWEDDFNHPTGGTLGVLNAIQVRRVPLFA